MKISIYLLIECPTLFHSAIRALISSLGVAELEREVVNISAITKHIEWQTTDTISALQEEEIHNLSHMVLQNRMDLNFLLAAQGVCAVINTTYCFYVDQSRRIKKDLFEIQKQTQIFHEVSLRNNTLNFDYIFHTLTSWLPNWGWIKEMFIVVVIIVVFCMIAGCINQCCG